MRIDERLKEYEGTKQYQKTRGYFRDNKFYPYKDSLGKSTIGYGHLITSENFTNGITEQQADALLSEDINLARIQYSKLSLVLPQDWEDFMVIMIFQLGLGGVQKFRKMLAALKVQDYKTAIKEAKDSLWYKQTPNRLNQMISVLTNK
jgi:GH24 family phage-related lysozyme (muramidase)